MMGSSFLISNLTNSEVHPAGSGKKLAKLKKIWKIIFHMFGIHKLFPVLPVLLPDPAGWTSEFVKFDIKNELPIIKTSKPMYHTLG